VGKARLERAISDSPDVDVTVSWLPFFLRPDMPKDGREKGGTPESRVGDWLKRLNVSEGPSGISFTGKCDRYPNTESYQIGMAYLLANHGPKAQSRASSSAFAAYYRDGIYIGSGAGDEALTKLCKAAVPELDSAAFLAELKDAGALKRVQARAFQLKKKHRVSGVPFFIVNGKGMFSGAQEPPAFVEAFARA